MKLTLVTHTTTELDLGEPDPTGHFDGGDLGFYNGNLYLLLDGIEYGSLLFTLVDGKPNISLGHFTDTNEQWTQANPLTGPVTVDGRPQTYTDLS